MHSPLYWITLVAVVFALLILSIGITRALSSVRLPAGAVVVVTGGSRGLGFAIASRFARKLRARLVLASRHMDELEQAKSRLLTQYQHLKPEDIHLVEADLAKPAECQRLIAESFARFGRIDVLVNNAGIMEVGPAEIQPIEAFERALQINFLAAFHATWAALPRLLQQAPIAGPRRAAIVNIASIGGKIAVPHMLPYTTAKFALVGFSEGLHAELHGKKVLVTTVCPGLMRTGGEAHAKFIGNIEGEKRWFNFAAKSHIFATSVEHAANKIFRAVESNRAEITITPQAWLAARFGAICPETLQFANAVTNELILPAAPPQSTGNKPA
jgi:NAD(P)-dependent dehydrogenase (short-subunit alcohol dehydrogenase family)